LCRLHADAKSRDADARGWNAPEFLNKTQMVERGNVTVWQAALGPEAGNAKFRCVAVSTMYQCLYHASVSTSLRYVTVASTICHCRRLYHVSVSLDRLLLTIPGGASPRNFSPAKDLLEQITFECRL
jgi:hypothetical protein